MEDHNSSTLEAIGGIAVAVVSMLVLASVIAPGPFFSVLGGGLAALGGFLLRLAFGGR